MKERRKMTTVWFEYVPFLCLVLCMEGIAGCFYSAFLDTAFGSPHSFVLYAVLVVFCLFWMVFYRIRMEGVYRFLAFLAVMVAESLLLLLLQRVAIGGFLQTANAIIQSVNQCYHAELALYQVQGDSISVMLCVLFVLFPLTGMVALGLLHCKNVWYVLAVLFPFLTFLFLAGGTPSGISVVIILMSVLMGIAANIGDMPVELCREAVRGRVMLVTCGYFLLISVPAYFIVCPILKIPTSYLNDKAVRTENGVLATLWQVLPQLSGGRLQLQVEGSAGGVDEGELWEEQGYHFGKMKALEVTCSQQPAETLYLKGYIGAYYTGDSFLQASAEQFGQIFSSWGISEKPTLYIQNLPFLRMMYQENVSLGSGEDDEPQLAGELSSSALELTVTNLNANPAYTYVPYNAFLNDYYEVLAGDGAVAGQTAAEDVYSFYPVEALKEGLTEWQEQEDAHGVLDSIEISYENFVKNMYLQLPESGLEELAAMCQEMQDKEPEEICDFVAETLSRQCQFSDTVENPPEGEDFVEWFLYHEKKGYSTHFAAAATLMFRYCGVPARYVVGYAIPESVFMPQTDGSYLAVAEDDNAHAWAEIYLSGIGWVPVETTPGYVGRLTTVSGDSTLQNADYEQEEQIEDEEALQERDPEESTETGEHHGILVKVLVSIGVAVGVIVMAIWIRRMLLLRKRLGKGRQSTSENLKQVYRSLYHMLRTYEDSAVPGCSDENFAPYLSHAFPVVYESECEALAQSVLHACYGEGDATVGELSAARWLYLRIARQVGSMLPFGQMMRFYLWDCFL